MTLGQECKREQPELKSIPMVCARGLHREMGSRWGQGRVRGPGAHV